MKKLRLTYTMFFKNSNDIYTKTTKNKKKKGKYNAVMNTSCAVPNLSKFLKDRKILVSFMIF